jgi:hypothetical protein
VGAQEPNSPEKWVCRFPVQLPGFELPPEKLHTSMKKYLLSEQTALLRAEGTHNGMCHSLVVK